MIEHLSMTMVRSRPQDEIEKLSKRVDELEAALALAHERERAVEAERQAQAEWEDAKCWELHAERRAKVEEVVREADEKIKDAEWRVVEASQEADRRVEAERSSSAELRSQLRYYRTLAVASVRQGQRLTRSGTVAVAQAEASR